MKWNFIIILLFGPCFGVFAQSIFPGYASTIHGETIDYTSYTPIAGYALLSRANTGKMAIVWQTDLVPLDFKGDTAYFNWIGGNAAGTATGNAHFDLYLNGNYALTIITSKDYQAPEWYFSNSEGVSVRFLKKAIDRNNDVSGDVILAVPKKILSPGKSLTLKLVGQKQGIEDWMMVYQFHMNDQFLAKAYPLLKRSANGDTLRVLKFYGEYQKTEGLLQLNQVDSNISVSKNRGMDLKDFMVHNGYNEFEFDIPYHSGEKQAIIKLSLDHQPWVTDTVDFTNLVPLELHLVHHSHNDIGYSELQPVVASIQNSNIRNAIRLIQKTRDYPYDAQFRWNVESLWA